ncbi:hypothetical protein EV401DRAFT_2070993 [Pisolithus croceorrhizus]|nr:hypothetical protein EV401DRAFT_2070993 [Pisolithus croceorrhizus]
MPVGMFAPNQIWNGVFSHPTGILNTPEGRACSKALIDVKTPVRGQAPVPATPPAVKADQLSKPATRPRKRVRVDAPSLSPCFSHPNEAVSTAALTSRPSSPDPSNNFALIIRSMLVAALDALDKSLEEQGVSKALGKRHSRDRSRVQFSQLSSTSINIKQSQLAALEFDITSRWSTIAL